MSRLTDLLSTIKQAEHKKEVPPGLSDSVSSIKRKNPGKRLIVFFVVLISAAVALGLAASYMADHLRGRIIANSAPAAPLASSEGSAPKEAAAGSGVVEKTASVEPPVNRTASYGLKKSTEQMFTPTGSTPHDAPRESASNPARSPVTSREERTDEEDASKERTGLFYRARDFELSGDLPKAVQAYQKVVELEPRNYRAMNNIASLYMRMERPKEALRYLEDSLKIKGDYVPALINTGILQARANGVSEAEVSFLKALSIDGSNRTALFNLAALYENTQRYGNAREYYRKLDLLGDTEGANGLKRLVNRP